MWGVIALATGVENSRMLKRRSVILTTGVVYHPRAVLSLSVIPPSILHPRPTPLDSFSSLHHQATPTPHEASFLSPTVTTGSPEISLSYSPKLQAVRGTVASFHLFSGSSSTDVHSYSTVDELAVSPQKSSTGMKRWGKQKLPEKTSKMTASPGTISKCKNPGATPLGIEPGSHWWEASSLTTTPPQPHFKDDIPLLATAIQGPRNKLEHGCESSSGSKEAKPCCVMQLTSAEGALGARQVNLFAWCQAAEPRRECTIIVLLHHQAETVAAPAMGWLAAGQARRHGCVAADHLRACYDSYPHMTVCVLSSSFAQLGLRSTISLVLCVTGRTSTTCQAMYMLTSAAPYSTPLSAHIEPSPCHNFGHFFWNCTSTLPVSLFVVTWQGHDTSSSKLTCDITLFSPMLTETDRSAKDCSPLGSVEELEGITYSTTSIFSAEDVSCCHMFHNSETPFLDISRDHDKLLQNAYFLYVGVHGAWATLAKKVLNRPLPTITTSIKSRSGVSCGIAQAFDLRTPNSAGSCPR
ncbi:hypothetical protein PR048_023752 [Dryococelus australis]|uniref:Uncharacterized protein n=1 Tax=Dryococelus australis TaxID=614101 RepID=A0ABQ9GV18_9NEOP|nr:hypothetical protein PR048_023752 [Dryococelus australis]